MGLGLMNHAWEARMDSTLMVVAVTFWVGPYSYCEWIGPAKSCHIRLMKTGLHVSLCRLADSGRKKTLLASGYGPKKIILKNETLIVNFFIFRWAKNIFNYLSNKERIKSFTAYSDLTLLE